MLFTSLLKPFETEESGQSILREVAEYPLEITDVTRKTGREAPPRAFFDLTSLQVECNRKYGMSADQTLKTIQTLYEEAHHVSACRHHISDR